MHSKCVKKHEKSHFKRKEPRNRIRARRTGRKLFFGIFIHLKKHAVWNLLVEATALQVVVALTRRA